ncbi:MAG: hypothetical protein ABJO27_07405 [Pseudoruegeria sp.]
MTAALTLLIILAVSLFVVRIGGTALRLTGLPQDTARFQAISALTGTGFTTREAETLMHHSVRRRVLVGLMFAGHLGVVSLATTIIIAVSAAQEGTVFTTIIYMCLAVGMICAIAMSRRFDRLMCGFIAVILTRLGWFNEEQHRVIAELPNGSQIAEHTAHHPCVVDPNQVGLTILSPALGALDGAGLELNVGDRIMCCGSVTAQLEFAQLLKATS